jgi:hypothetical protein
MTATTQANLLTITRHTPHSHQEHFIIKNNSSQPPLRYSTSSHSYEYHAGTPSYSYQAHFLTATRSTS